MHFFQIDIFHSKQCFLQLKKDFRKFVQPYPIYIVFVDMLYRARIQWVRGRGHDNCGPALYVSITHILHCITEQAPNATSLLFITAHCVQARLKNTLTQIRIVLPITL